MMINDVDQALIKFKELCSKFPKKLNEADTRAKMIDPVFLECLGWDNNKDISREPHSNPGYVDYLFSIDGIPHFVIEAKKGDDTFFIPQSFTGKYYRTSGALWSDKKIKNAIIQAQKYCILCGVHYGIVTNGQQYIIFEAFKRGSDWRNGNCIIFSSIEDISSNFSTFWNILNKHCVKLGSLRRFVSQENNEVKYIFRPIDRLHTKSSTLIRNNLSPLLTPITEHVFWDIIDEEQVDILKECYVYKRQYQQAFQEINNYFDTVPEFAKKFGVKDVFQTEGFAGSFQESYEKLNKLSREKSVRGSLILIMGGIGSGKTTFIHHYFSIMKPKNTLWFYINFFDVSENETEIEKFIINLAFEEFEKKYKKHFENELSLLKIDCVTQDIRELKALFSFLKLKGYSIALVLDNVDQHSYVNKNYQEQALLVAKRLTDALETITILSLREENFFKSVMGGVLDSFPAQCFHISSPNFEDLIRVRLEYSIKLLKNNGIELKKIVKNHSILEASREITQTFLEIVENSLRSSRRIGREILMFIKEVSGGDMRTALSFFRTFLVSGNTDIEEMLTRHGNDLQRGLPGYEIPFHHVIKSVILEHSRLYQMSKSKILNVFDFNSTVGGSSHFTILRIMNYLKNRLSGCTQQGRGFVEIDSIINEGEKVGINRTIIDDALITLAAFGLIEFENQSKKGYEYATYVRITNTGLYYIRYLIKKFVYLDLVWMDTPMVKEDIVEKLLKLVVETKPQKLPQDVESRLLRTTIFIEYLHEVEQNELKNHAEYTDSDLTRNTFIPKIKEHFEKEKQYILSKRRRNYN